MAAKRAAVPLQCARSFLTSSITHDPLMQCLLPRLTSRTMATEAPFSSTLIPSTAPPSHELTSALRRPAPPMPQVLATLYAFPTMEPQSFTNYPAKYLDLPLRRDILHRAVVYEGDMARQGSANTKMRDEIRGSGRKLRPQKGSGRARLGDRSSPMLRGGAVSHGPRPRDFSTDLPKKIYDLAWRTALSYRYRKGELVIIGEMQDLENPEPRWVEQIFNKLKFGRASGRSLIITKEELPNLYSALAGAGSTGLAKTEDDIDVKDLLEMGRIVIEKEVLDSILKNHASDVDRVIPSAVGL